METLHPGLSPPNCGIFRPQEPNVLPNGPETQPATVTTSKDVHNSGSPRQSSSRLSYLVQRRKSNVSIILSTIKRLSRAEFRVKSKKAGKILKLRSN